MFVRVICVHVVVVCIFCLYICVCVSCVRVVVVCIFCLHVCMFVSVCVCECMCESVCECPCFRGNGRSQGSQQDLAVFGLCLELLTYPRAGCSESHFSPEKPQKVTDLLHVETNTVVHCARVVMPRQAGSGVRQPGAG